MRKRVLKSAVAAIVYACLLPASESVALPQVYVTQTPAPAPAAVRQERFIDLIDIQRLVRLVPYSKRANAERDFASWNARRKDASLNFAKKYVAAKDSMAKRQATSRAFVEQKSLAFDKLALFEEYKIGHIFFAPGAKNVTARLRYLNEIFQRMEPKQRASGDLPTFALIFPNTSEYLATLQVESSTLLKHFTDNFVERAHADEDCPNPGAQKGCASGKDGVCTPVTVGELPYVPADGGSPMNQLKAEGISFRCNNEGDVDESLIAGAALISVYEFAETHYVCADTRKNVSTRPSAELQAKIYLDSVLCENDEAAFRNVSVFLFEDPIEDGPIPDGCVGINKIRKKNRSEDIAESSWVYLNAAPCWEEHWQCRYKADPQSTVTDPKLMHMPDAPKCPS